MLAFDHVLGAGLGTQPSQRGYTSDILLHEVLVLFGYLAAVTTRPELVTEILVLPQRQTALVAKQVAEVDVPSGGRLLLGVGVGWNDVEYQAFGVSFADRGVRSEEQVEVLRRLWAAPTITSAGRWHWMDNAGIKPRPVRRRIPVWFGGHAEATLRRVDRLGGGWLPEFAPDEVARGPLDRVRGTRSRPADRQGDWGRAAADPHCGARRQPGAPRAGWRDPGDNHLDVNTKGLGTIT